MAVVKIKKNDNSFYCFELHDRSKIVEASVKDCLLKVSEWCLDTDSKHIEMTGIGI